MRDQGNRGGGGMGAAVMGGGAVGGAGMINAMGQPQQQAPTPEQRLMQRQQMMQQEMQRRQEQQQIQEAQQNPMQMGQPLQEGMDALGEQREVMYGDTSSYPIENPSLDMDPMTIKLILESIGQEQAENPEVDMPMESRFDHLLQGGQTPLEQPNQSIEQSLMQSILGGQQRGY